MESESFFEVKDDCHFHIVHLLGVDFHQLSFLYSTHTIAMDVKFKNHKPCVLSC